MIPRSNFNETAFFYPQLKSNYNGSVGFSFSMPDALTKWKFMALVHNKELKSGYYTKEFITQKELMINTFAPRFFREGDELYFTAKVTNLSSHDIDGIASLELRDPISNDNIASAFSLSRINIPFFVSHGESQRLEWKINVPTTYSLVRYTAKVTSEKFSDAEENTIPIVSNRQLITESFPLWVNGNDSNTFNLPGLDRTSHTKKNDKVSLEFTSNPAWSALESLPYLMEYPYECAEQTFNRFFANSIGAHIAKSDPRINEIFIKWNTTELDTFKSKLENNQTLKNILLEETPWVREATNEYERKKRLAVLFDLNRMSNECKANQERLSDMQLNTGAFPWFSGGMGDRYITQYIVAGFGRLKKLGILCNQNDDMIKNAISYLDNQINMDYVQLKRNKQLSNKNNLNSIQIHYLYARSFFKNIPYTYYSNDALTYYFRQAKKYCNKRNNYEQGMIALVMERMNEKQLSAHILDGLKDRSIYSDELGMYWKGMLQGG